MWSAPSGSISGAKAISDNTTREDIERYNLREVRIDTYQKWYEMLMN